MMGGAALLLSLLGIGSGAPARRRDAFLFQGDRRDRDRDAGRHRHQNILQLNTTMFELYGNAAQGVQEEHRQ
jgi:hypothetical protein